MKKILNILIIVYIIVAIFVTTCLLFYNDYDTTAFGDKTLVIVKDNIGKFKKGSLLIVGEDNTYKENSQVFYYLAKSKKYYIKLGTVKEVNDDTVTINKDIVNKDDIIGINNNIIVLPLMGSILTLLESKWGYLIVIILPVLLAFIYEIYSILKEFKKSK